MIAPFYKFGLFGDEVSLIVAFIIGIAFGFFLERAGFGNARLLAAQFYFKDMRVLKVMFTAIITAMTGLFVLSRVGVVDLSLVYLTPTFLGPQIVGGIILGVGFVIGGYCPGTSCVSASTGRIDGMVYVVGIIAGLVGYAEIYPFIEKFTHLTSLGKVTLPQLFHVPYGLLVLAVVLMAVGAFLAAEWVEGIFGGRKPDADSLLAPVSKFGPSRKLAAALIGLGVIAAFAGTPYRDSIARVDTRELALNAGGKNDHVTVDTLAHWIIAGQIDYLLVDLRDPTDYATYHIPGAINVPLAELSNDLAPRNERIVFYSDGGIHAAQAWFLLRSLGFKNTYMLLGGLDLWMDDILFPSLATDATAADTIAFAERAAISKFFGGTPRTGVDPGAASENLMDTLAPPPPVESNGLSPVKTKRKKEGC